MVLPRRRLGCAGANLAACDETFYVDHPRLGACRWGVVSTGWMARAGEGSARQEVFPDLFLLPGIQPPFPP
jgi:hypothetical protein